MRTCVCEWGKGQGGGAARARRHANNTKHFHIPRWYGAARVARYPTLALQHPDGHVHKQISCSCLEQNKSFPFFASDGLKHPWPLGLGKLALKRLCMKPATTPHKMVYLAESMVHRSSFQQQFEIYLTWTAVVSCHRLSPDCRWMLAQGLYTSSPIYILCIRIGLSPSRLFSTCTASSKTIVPSNGEGRSLKDCREQRGMRNLW